MLKPADTTETEKQIERRDGSVLMIVLAIAAVIRVMLLDHQSISMDEAAEWATASRSVSEIVFNPDGFPPLYHLILHGWIQSMPVQISPRWMSVAFDLGSIAVAFTLARNLLGSMCGRWTAVLMALSPFMIHHALEARSYSLLMLVAVTAIYFQQRVLVTNSKAHWAGFVVTCLVGVYLHYYFVFLPLISGVIMSHRLWKSPSTERHEWLRRCVTGYGLLVALSLPAAALLRADFAFEKSIDVPAPFGVEGFGYTYFSFVTGFAIGPSKRALHTMPATEAIREILPWLLVTGLALVIVAARGWLELRRCGRTLFLSLLILAPVLAIGWLGSVVGFGYKVRYVCWVAPFFYIWIAAGLSRPGRLWIRAIPVALLAIVFSVAIFQRNFVEDYQTEDVRSLAMWLEAESDSSVPVFVVTRYMANPLARYLHEPWLLQPVPDAEQDGGDIDQALGFLQNHAGPQPRFWFVYSRPFHGDKQGKLLQHLLHSGHMRHRQDFAGVQLYQGAWNRTP